MHILVLCHERFQGKVIAFYANPSSMIETVICLVAQWIVFVAADAFCER